MRLLILFLLLSLGADAQIIRANPFYRPTAAAAGFLLDDYPGAAVGYSLRKLDNDYTGSAIRVRRKSDNSEQNIGFVDNFLDTSELKNFVGTSATDTGWVTTWYDQSGGNRDATQSTANKQPIIVSAGLIVRHDGDVALDFYSATIRLSYTRQSASTSADFYFLHYSTGAYLLHTSSSVSVYGYVGQSGSTNTLLYSNFGTPTLYTNGTLRTPANRGQVFTLYNNLYRFSSIIGANISNASWSTIRIGDYGSSSLGLVGKLVEYVYYSTSNSSNRTGIETNINNYYGLW